MMRVSRHVDFSIMHPRSSRVSEKSLALEEISTVGLLGQNRFSVTCYKANLILWQSCVQAVKVAHSSITQQMVNIC